MEQYIKEYIVLAGCLAFGLVYFCIMYYIDKYILKVDRKNIEELNTWYD